MSYSYTPKVNVAKELSETSEDFTNPRELIRETIANSLDASASNIVIEALKDNSLGDDELVIRISDDGIGMTQVELENFFDLGFSNKRNNPDAIGYKGHGTKITYNSSCVTVLTRSIEGGTIYKASLTGSRRSLTLAARNNGEPPKIEISEASLAESPHFTNKISGTVIEIRGYDKNNWDAFAHVPLMDYIQWFTAWGRIHSIWGGTPNAPCTLHLRGIGESAPQEIPYGHPFPDEKYDFRDLRRADERRPENYFVRRWISDPLIVEGFPHHELRIAFSVEGDSAKRAHNLMLKRVGRPSGMPFPYEAARYTVSDRYGIYVCKDFIPIERKNERFADRSEWTKWHAFINCQSFSLTANRSSVENTPADLLTGIYKTAEQYITTYILGSDEYEDFARRVELEAGRRKADRERKDVGRRLKESQRKKRYRVSDANTSIEFLEPRTEQGVVWLLARLLERWPDKFPNLSVVDLDSHFGYDVLVVRKHHLTGAEEPAFVELKHNLRDAKDFNHSFEYLYKLICWGSDLHVDEEVVDIRNQRRVFKVAQPDEEHPYSRYFLNNPSGGLNVEVLVLSKYLSDVLNLEKV